MPILCALIATGCLRPGRDTGLYQRLQSDDPAVRVAAVVEAGHRDDEQAVPYLIDRLEDDQADIRLFAIVALRRIVGEDFGYRSYATERVRLEAIERWRQWLKAECNEEERR